MKKINALLMFAILTLGLVACGGNALSFLRGASAFAQLGQPEPSAQRREGPKPAVKPGRNAGSNTLVVYFSVPEATSPDNMNREEENSTVVINGEVLGNTQYIAYLIRQNTGGDIFRIEPVTPYPMNHEELEAAATREARENALPRIAGNIGNIERYDTIFVGYPNWYSDMPRIIYSFFGQYDFSGKTIIPFVTSGASGFSNTISTIEELQPGATVVRKGLSVLRSEAAAAESAVISWLAELGYQAAASLESSP